MQGGKDDGLWVVGGRLTVSELEEYDGGRAVLRRASATAWRRNSWRRKRGNREERRGYIGVGSGPRIRSRIMKIWDEEIGSDTLGFLALGLKMDDVTVDVMLGSTCQPE